MKKLLALCFTVIVVIVSIFATSLSTDKNNKRIHQHVAYRADVGCTCDRKELCTHLPIVIINTNNKSIPGEIIEGSNEVTKTENNEDMLLSSIKIMDNKSNNNHPSDIAEINKSALISIRGNSSRKYDKKNYLLRFVNEESKYIDVGVMGMDEHYEWALHGPYLDKAFIRNYMCYNIAGEIMDYAPNVRFCEVILNDKYIGLYLMTETISTGKNSRLNLREPIVGTNSSGYILRLDKGAANDLKNIRTFTNYSYRNLLVYDIRYPRSGELTKELAKSIEQEYSQFEKALFSYDYDTDDYGYWNYIDVDSFVDYFILNEFSLNYDAGWLSTYIYKDIGGKYKLAVWDFNSAFDNYQEEQQPLSFELRNTVLYYMLLKDERFTQKIISRYKELRKTVLSEEYLNDYINSTIQFLGDAITRNNEVWGYVYEYDLLSPLERNPKNFEEAVSDLKKVIRVRGEWMDKNIEVLKQFSHESKVKKFNH